MVGCVLYVFNAPFLELPGVSTFKCFFFIHTNAVNANSPTLFETGDKIDNENPDDDVWPLYLETASDSVKIKDSANGRTARSVSRRRLIRELISFVRGL